MAQIGYKLSSEEHGPNELVRDARMAEDVGFGFALISDATQQLRLGTGDVSDRASPPRRRGADRRDRGRDARGTLLPRVGSGENLNEHVIGAGWPKTEVRQERLQEAIEVIRRRWAGGNQSHHGPHYTVENARIYTLPALTPGRVRESWEARLRSRARARPCPPV